MGKAPALASCMFCDSLPCQCAKIAATARRQRAKGAAPVPVELNHAPVATRKRFDATDAMATGAAKVASVAPPAVDTGAVTPAATTEPIDAPFVPYVAPRAPTVQSAQARGDDNAMNYAVHLVKVALGGTVV